MNPRIIIITGTPGVGKTTISRRLARRLSLVHVDISQLVARKRLYTSRDAYRRTLIADLKRLRRKLDELFNDKPPKGFVISTHYLGDIVPAWRVRIAFVLRLNPNVLRKRLRRRRWVRVKVDENVEAELIGVCLSEAVDLFGVKKVHEIDTTDRRGEAIVREMVRIVEKGNTTNKVKGKGGEVDWLGTVAADSRRKSNRQRTRAGTK